MRLRRVILALAAAFGLAGVVQAAELDVAYTIHPVLKDGALQALAVEARFRGDADGETKVSLPGGVRQGFSFDGPPQVLGQKAGVVLGHQPGAALTVRYEIVSGYEGLPASQPMEPLLQPDWFVVHGERAFARPEGRDGAHVAFAWRGLPAGWLGVAHSGNGATVGELVDGYLLGGTGWREDRRRTGRATIRILYRPAGWETPPALAFDTLAAAVKAGFDYWDEPPRDFFVPIVQLRRGDSGGRGLADGFQIYAGQDVDLRPMLRTFTHEHQHSWISRRIGGFPGFEDNLEAWLNEGFNDAVTARVLLRAGLWSPEDFAADLNATLVRYGTSPVREAPNRRIQEARSMDPDVRNLPYDRGRLLALRWERRLRAETGGRIGLRTVLLAQRDAARGNTAAGRKVSADVLFPQIVRQVAGVDLADDMARWVDRGDGLELPADLFAACGRIEWTSQLVFDRGFDLAATLKNGRRVTGLDPAGPAARAGLKDGERIRISEVPSHDSQTPLTYRVVEADGRERAVTYNPEGKGEVRVQRFVLAAMDAAGRERCRRVLVAD